MSEIADNHQFAPGTTIADTLAWLAHHHATWEPLNPYQPGVRLLIHQQGHADIQARFGDTLHWDGTQIRVQNHT